MLGIAASLFVSRWVLMALGQTDLGLFSVIGGMVVFIKFLNNILAGATARFYAISIGQAKKNKDVQGLENCRKWFNTALTIHTILPLFLIAIGYPIANWAIHNWLTIPPDRIDACVWVLRFTCFSSFVAMINVPFHAMYTAKQYIAELTIYSMTETVMNIVFCYYMVSHPGEWLVRYALWMCFLSVMPQLIVCIRANIIFPECKFKLGYMWNMDYLKKIGSYVCWTFFGNFCALLRNQGISILINKAFGPKVNSAMHIAHQVNSGTSILSSALLKAFSPAITTACGAKDYNRMTTLAFTACKFSVILALVIAIPLSLELPEIILLWLKNPPDFTVGLCYFMIAMYICNVCTTGNMIVINANGNIKEYQLTLSTVYFFTFLTAIIAVCFGGNVYSIGAILVISVIIGSAWRVYFAQKLLNMSARRWIWEIMIPILILILITMTLGWLPHLFVPQCVARIFITTFLSELIFFPLVWFIVLKDPEREFIASKVKMFAKKLPYIQKV